MSLELSEHKRRVAATYDLASSGYDKDEVRFFRLCAERLVELIDLHPGQEVLDVGTGTGMAAIAAARSVGERGRVVGVDISKGMLSQARSNIEGAQLTTIELYEGDAEQLSFAEKSFDAVVCSIGIVFLPKMGAGPQEWKRVVKEGGVVAFSSFGEATFQPIADLFEARIRAYGVNFPVPSRPFPFQRLTTLEQCYTLLADAGLEQIKGHTEQQGYYLRTPEQWWEIVWNSVFRGIVSQLSPAQLEQFKEEHLAEVGQLASEKGIWIDIPSIFVWGYRPS